MNFNISTGAGIALLAAAILISFLLFFFSGDPSIHTLIRQNMLPFEASPKEMHMQPSF